jgi:ABC-2 type transport system permease protein
MNTNHLKAIARKEFYHVMRDPGMLLLVTVGPVFLMMVFTYMLTADVTNAPVAIVDHANTDISHELIARLNDAEVMEITEHLDNESEITALFERNEVVALIIIPKGYGEVNLLQMMTQADAILSGEVSISPQIEAIIDGTEPVSAGEVLDDVYRISDEYTREVMEAALGDTPLANLLEDWLELPIILETERKYNPDLRSVVDIYPGLAAMMLSLPAMALAMALAKESEEGTLEQLVATPIDKRALLVGKMAPYVVFGILDIYVLLAVGYFFYDVPFRGSLIDYSIISFLFLVANLGMALLIAVLIRSQQVAMIVAMLVFFVPPFFLAGLFFPAEAMPWIVQLEMIEFPATHFVVASKAIHLQGTSIVDLWFPTLILFILAVELIEIAAFLFRKKVIITFSWRKLLRMKEAAS